MLAAAGRALLYQFGGVGLGFLGTVRPDGGPRLHPVRVVLTDDGMYTFLIESPKQRDLLRDRRFAIHCYPPPDNEDAFYVTGRARRVDDDNEETSVRKTFWKERGQDEPPPQAEGQVVFEFLIETCLLTRTTGHGDWNPQHTIWKAP